MEFDNKRKIITGVGLALIILAGVIVYFPGLNGSFVFDDHFNIVDNQRIAIDSLDYSSLFDAAFSLEIGPLRRPLAMLSFALNHYFANGVSDALPFKVTNLAIHLINSLLVFWLVTLFSRRLALHPNFCSIRYYDWLPLTAAALWTLHPLHLTSVLYVVQRMNSLSALFVLSGLIAFIYGRQRIEERRSHGFALMTAGLVGGTLLGTSCKENAILLPLFIGLVEYFFFYSTNDRRRLRRDVALFYFLAIALPLLIGVVWLLTQFDPIIAPYEGRDFTLGERLLTQPRVLWFYVSLLLWPSTQRLTLFHDDLAISTGLFDPWTTSVALICLIFVVCMALLRARAFPVFCFSVLWYLAGHLVESSFIPLEIAHAHRNYLPDVGLIFGIVYGLGIIAEQLRHAAAGIAVYVLVIIVMAFSTYSYASIWGDDSSLASHMVRYHPGSARSHAMLADIHAKPGQDLIKAITHYKIAWDLNPRETGYLIRLVLITANADVTVRNSSDKDNFNPTISGLPKFISIQKYGGTARLYVDPKMLDRITEDLSVNILLPWSERRLYKFVACVTHNKPICGPLYPYADKWCNAILENPHTYRRLRENVFVILVRLYFEHGDLERALRYTRKARSYNSTNPQFALMEANVLIELNELEKAEHVAQALIEKNTAINEYIVKEAHILLRMIKVKREKLQ